EKAVNVVSDGVSGRIVLPQAMRRPEMGPACSANIHPRLRIMRAGLHGPAVFIFNSDLGFAPPTFNHFPQRVHRNLTNEDGEKWRRNSFMRLVSGAPLIGRASLTRSEP